MDVDTKTLKIIIENSPDLLEAAGLEYFSKTSDEWWLDADPIDPKHAEALLRDAMVRELWEGDKELVLLKTSKCKYRTQVTIPSARLSGHRYDTMLAALYAALLAARGKS